MDNNPVQTRFPNAGVGNTAGNSSVTNVSDTQGNVIHNPNVGMWVGFIHVVFFISLYFLATSSANILHEAVNRFVKDPLELETATRSYLGLFGIGSFKDYWLRYNLAALIVSFPIFISLFVYIERLISSNKGIADIRIRHLLIYISLVGTFLFFNYALIKVLYAFLDGSLNTRSILHMLVTVSISLIIFVYYLFAVKGDRK